MPHTFNSLCEEFFCPLSPSAMFHLIIFARDFVRSVALLSTTSIITLSSYSKSKKHDQTLNHFLCHMKQLKGFLNDVKSTAVLLGHRIKCFLSSNVPFGRERFWVSQDVDEIMTCERTISPISKFCLQISTSVIPALFSSQEDFAFERVLAWKWPKIKCINEFRTSQELLKDHKKQASHWEYLFSRLFPKQTSPFLWKPMICFEKPKHGLMHSSCT